MNLDELTEQQVTGELLRTSAEILTQFRAVDPVQANDDTFPSVLQENDGISVSDPDDWPGERWRKPPFLRRGGARENESQASSPHPPCCPQ